MIASVLVLTITGACTIFGSNIKVLQMKTKRLIFEMLGKKDFANYFRLVSNRDVMMMITGKPISEKDAKNKFQKIVAFNNSHLEIGSYQIKNKNTNKFIGLGKIVMTSENEAEIGYVLLPEYWGKGYGSEISEELVRHSKSINYINSLMAIIDPENSASKRILEKSNFILNKTCEMNGLPAEIYKLQLKRSESTTKDIRY